MATSLNRKGQAARAHARARLLLLVIAIIVSMLLLIGYARRADARHPAPRANAESLSTLAPGHFHNRQVAGTYQRAGKIKQILDGVFCYCFCKGAGHYSLLDCFRDEHGAGCDICLAEADLAFQLNERGTTLKEIRASIDHEFSR